jgi:uncharacterized metal-binding protein YceD (DUF177 family)
MSNPEADSEEFPISRPVAVTELLHGDTRELTIKADDTERRALADFLGIPDVRSAEAHLKLRAEPGRLFVLEGEVAADIVQTCIATLEPLDARVEGPIRRVYQDGPPQDDDLDLDPFSDDTPDEIVGGVIDGGAAVCEYIALEMEPYPRSQDAPEAEISADDGPSEADKRADNPFAVLAQMRDLEK